MVLLGREKSAVKVANGSQILMHIQREGLLAEGKNDSLCPGSIHGYSGDASWYMCCLPYWAAGIDAHKHKYTTALSRAGQLLVSSKDFVQVW